jgi:hypothetical protein
MPAFFWLSSMAGSMIMLGCHAEMIVASAFARNDASQARALCLPRLAMYRLEGQSTFRKAVSRA